MSIVSRALGWLGIAGGLVLAFLLSLDAGVTIWWIFGGIGVAAAIGLLMSAFWVATETSRKRPVDPGTRPSTWVQPVRPQPVAPAPQPSQSLTINIDTVNIYPGAEPVMQRLPAEVRRIYPAIER